MNKRLRLYEYIVRDLFKIIIGKHLPWYLIVLHYIFFPIKSLIILVDKTHPYDINTDLWNICGVKITSSFFTHVNMVGQTITILKNENGVITVHNHNHLKNKVTENTELTIKEWPVINIPSSKS